MKAHHRQGRARQAPRVDGADRRRGEGEAGGGTLQRPAHHANRHGRYWVISRQLIRLPPGGGSGGFRSLRMLVPSV